MINLHCGSCQDMSACDGPMELKTLYLRVSSLERINKKLLDALSDSLRMVREGCENDGFDPDAENIVRIHQERSARDGIWHDIENYRKAKKALAAAKGEG